MKYKKIAYPTPVHPSQATDAPSAGVSRTFRVNGTQEVSLNVWAGMTDEQFTEQLQSALSKPHFQTEEDCVYRLHDHGSDFFLSHGPLTQAKIDDLAYNKHSIVKMTKDTWKKIKSRYSEPTPWVSKYAEFTAQPSPKAKYHASVSPRSLIGVLIQKLFRLSIA